jgi:N-acyl-D-aspartate/D-glutamate deacylase
VLVGDAGTTTAHREIDATGKLVVPGFIDTHSHADSGGHLPQYLRQGVTTVVAGNCGSSPAINTLATHYAGLAGNLGPNYIGLIGHNRLRSEAGLSGSTPTTTQMNAMKQRIATGMSAGAFGMSTGLIYSTGFNSTTEEIIELATAVAAFGGIYATHMRTEGSGVLTAIEEALRIGRESGCHVQISHAKCSGPSAWGLSTSFLELIDAAIDEGIEVRLDQYPYTASQTTINVLFPQWAQVNWNDAVTNQRARLLVEVAAGLAGRGGANRVYLISGAHAWRYLDELADTLGKEPAVVLVDDIGLNGANAVYHTMHEDDVRTLMPHRELMIGSDGPTSGHPRGSGTFPRFWGHYARDLAMFDHREAVRKTSTLAARQFRLLEQRRGRIAPGWFADIVVLNPDTIIDRATYSTPTATPLGVEHVFVNGTAALTNGSPTAARAGRVLNFADSKNTVQGSRWVVE